MTKNVKIGRIAAMESRAFPKRGFSQRYWDKNELTVPSYKGVMG